MEQFLTSSRSKKTFLFHSSLVWWKWSHLGGTFQKPDASLPLVGAITVIISTVTQSTPCHLHPHTHLPIPLSQSDVAWKAVERRVGCLTALKQ